MSEKKSLGLLFIISILLSVFSTFSFIFSITQLSSNDIDHTILITLFLSYVALLSSSYRIINLKKQEKKKIFQKEKNVRDYYNYHQLLNPPEIDN